MDVCASTPVQPKDVDLLDYSDMENTVLESAKDHKKTRLSRSIETNLKVIRWLESLPKSQFEEVPENSSDSSCGG